MKEVKFKAWDKWEKEMLPVAGINFTNGFMWINELIDDETPANTRYLDEVVLRQYTGLKDEKGIDVFEKDIVNIVELGKNILEYVSVVEYENSGYLVTEPNGTQVPLDCFHNQENAVMPLFEIEVIGNAFENPDLLEGEK